MLQYEEEIGGIEGSMCESVHRQSPPRCPFTSPLNAISLHQTSRPLISLSSSLTTFRLLHASVNVELSIGHNTSGGSREGRAVVPVGLGPITLGDAGAKCRFSKNGAPNHTHIP